MSVIWDWPQLTWLVLAVFGFGITAAKHGETTRYNVVTGFIALCLSAWLLWAGGFWHKDRRVCPDTAFAVPLDDGA